MLLNSANVRCQAALAALSSKRGVVSLLKPCCVPGYFTASNFTLAAFSAASKGGHIALMRSSFSANTIKSGALIAATLSSAGAELRPARGQHIHHAAAAAEADCADPAVAAPHAFQVSRGHEVLLRFRLVELAEQVTRLVFVAGVSAERKQAAGTCCACANFRLRV